jgi:hypothetical protein
MALAASTSPVEAPFWLIGVTVDKDVLLKSCLAFQIAYPAMMTIDMIARRRDAGKMVCSRTDEATASPLQGLRTSSSEDSRLARSTVASIADIPGEILSQIRLHTLEATLSWMEILVSKLPFHARGDFWATSNEWYPQWRHHAGPIPPSVSSMTPRMMVQRCLAHWGFMAMFAAYGDEHSVTCARPACTITTRPFRSWIDATHLPIPSEELKQRFGRIIQALRLQLRRTPVYVFVSFPTFSERQSMSELGHVSDVGDSR